MCLALLLSGAVGACGVGASPTTLSDVRGTSTASSRVEATPTSLPSGVSEEDAIRIARTYSTLQTLMDATAGPFGWLNADTNPEASPNSDPGRLVWAITFAGNVSLCPPPVGPATSSCYPSRPGTTVVYLDYVTGNFLVSRGSAAK